MAHISGTSGPDNLDGGVLADFIEGLGGSDTIDGRSNGDVLEGGTGNDSIRGGAGGDVLRGGDGTDFLNPGSSADIVDGGPGVDTLVYDSGVVAIEIHLGGIGKGGDADGDDIRNVENVSTESYRGDAAIYGDDGRNSFSAGNGDDTMFAGGGNDALNGGAGDDQVFGEAGNDLIFYTAGADNIDGGTGFDTMDYSGTFGVGIDLGFHSPNSGAAAGDVLNSIERVIGSSFADTMLTGNGSFELDGGDGDDTLGGSVTFGSQTLVGGAGLDHMQGEVNNDRYVEEHIDGQADEILEGADSTGGGNLDVLAMRLDEISTIVQVGTALAVVGTNGEEEMRIEQHFAGHAVERFLDLSGQIGTVVLSTALVGGNLPGIIAGTDGGETLNGRGGDDVVFANGGDDLLLGGRGGDRLLGQGGDDTVRGGDGNDLVRGGGGDDSLQGGQGGDILKGGAGDDTIGGGEGDDTLTGGLGSDLLRGGGGHDRFTYGAADAAPGSGVDTILGFKQGDDAIDLATLPGALAFIGGASFSAAHQVRFAADGGDTLLQVNLDADAATVELEIRIAGTLPLNADDLIL